MIDRASVWSALIIVLSFGSALGCDSESVTPCESSRECSAGGLVCDRSLGRCVQCVTGADCFVAGEICRASSCEVPTPCMSSRECPGLVCDAIRGFCVECVADLDCPGPEMCDADGFCQTPPPTCVSDRMCSDVGLVCNIAAGECVECVRDVDCDAPFLCMANVCRPSTRFDAARPDSGGVDAGPRNDAEIDAGLDAGFDGGSDGGFDSGFDGGFDSGPMCMQGSLLIVMDASASMANAPDGTTGVPIATSRWGRARAALATWMTGLPDMLEVGLVLFPTPGGTECQVSTTFATVPVAPLSTNRALINSALSGTPVGNTPLLAGLDFGYDLALALSPTAPRAVLLVADGDDNCDAASALTILPRVASMRAMGIETYVLGLTHESNLLSTIALDGGTRTSPTCVGLCQADACETMADCAGTTTCVTFLPGLPGNCRCSAAELCPAPLVCGPSGLPLGPPNTCSGNANCCSYVAEAATFDAEVAASLLSISSDFVTPCL